MGYYDHPDDQWMDPKRIQRGKWREQVKEIPEEHRRPNGKPDFATLPEGVYHIPTDSISVTDPGRVRKKSGSALERNIAEKGVSNPVKLVTYPSGGYAVSDGNHRVNASGNLGLPTVPAMVIHSGNKERMQRWYPHLNRQQFGDAK